MSNKLIQELQDEIGRQMKCQVSVRVQNLCWWIITL